LLEYQLENCVWEITLACCFSCKYCGSGGGRARANELSTEECIGVAEQLAELGCRRVSMIGGEVFMRRDWREIVAALSEKNIAVNIITNGFIFSKELIDDLKSLRVESLSVSLDGPKEVHDRYRQAGSFERAIAAIDILSANDIPVSVISTLNRENAEQLEELYAILSEYPIYAWQLQACSPMGNAASNGVDYSFDFKKVIDFVGMHMLTSPFALGIADNIGYFTPKEGYLRGNLSGKAVFPGCSAGLESIGIDSVGNVRGCESMYDDVFIEGNLREKTLREIWEDENAFAYNRKFKAEELTGKCSSCEMSKICAGGCRSYNYFVHKKLYESPHCAR